jgi:hypothetical protein
MIGFMLMAALPQTSIAQPRGHQGQTPFERARQYKEQYIVEMMALQDDEARKFLPVYRKYEDERFAIRRKEAALKRGFMAKNDEALKKDLEQLMAVKEEEVAVERKYMKIFLEMLSPRQVAALYHADNQFRRRMIERFGVAQD